MRCNHTVDKRHEALAYHIRLGIGERIEDESVSVDIHQHVAEIILEHAAAAAAKGEHLQPCGAGELGRVGHSGAGCA